jgi:hypothetical protein
LEEEFGVARQQKKLPARRQGAMDESLLIRSAESLGRVIGTLQRQLDAARRLVGPAAVERRNNGHAPARQRSGASATSATKATAATKTTAAAKRKTASARKRPATKGRASKNR